MCESFPELSKLTSSENAIILNKNIEQMQFILYV